MENQAKELREDVFSSFCKLAGTYPLVQDAQMLVGASEATAALKRQLIHRSVDVEWIQMVEDTLPYLDVIMRNPSVAIEDVEEVTPVELARHISEKSIRHLAQHSNLILKVEGDQVTPAKILSIYRDETLLTYENKFVNTLINRLFNFVARRYKAISEGAGTQQLYNLQYTTHFSHEQAEGNTNVNINLQMELDAPLTQGISQQEQEYNDNYARQIERAEKIYHTLAGYTASSFVKKMGSNFVRPPVIRTNAILKNRNLRACLNLWEYMDTYDKAGFSESRDSFQEMPSKDYIRDLYATIALQYVTFYTGVMENQAENRLLTEKHLDPVMPEFTTDEVEKQEQEFSLQETHYEKITPVSRLMNAQRDLSEDEKKIRSAIDIALQADEALEQKRLEEEAEARRLEEEARRKAEEEEARRLAQEEEARRQAALEEERRLAQEAEARRIAQEEEARRLALEEEARQKAEEARREAEAAEAQRIAREEEAKRMAEELRQVKEELEALRLAAQEEAQIQARREEARRRAQLERERKQAQIDAAENLYYYSREDYLSLPRKKKKKVLTDLKRLHDYEAALVQQSRTGKPGNLPIPPNSREWEEIRRWERSVMPKKK